MEAFPRLKKLERQTLLNIPQLFPDGDSDLLKIPRSSREEISYAIQHLIGLDLISASAWDGANPSAPYYRNLELTIEGEKLRRYLALPLLVRLLETEWKWFLTTMIALIALGLSLWGRSFH